MVIKGAGVGTRTSALSRDRLRPRGTFGDTGGAGLYSTLCSPPARNPCNSSNDASRGEFGKELMGEMGDSRDSKDSVVLERLKGEGRKDALLRRFCRRSGDVGCVWLLSSAVGAICCCAGGGVSFNSGDGSETATTVILLVSTFSLVTRSSILKTVMSATEKSISSCEAAVVVIIGCQAIGTVGERPRRVRYHSARQVWSAYFYDCGFILGMFPSSDTLTTLKSLILIPL